MRGILVLALLCLTLTAGAYPLYKQCDSRWKNDKMGTSSKTICQVGCLMSSVSMTIPGQNPKTLNHWLTNNHGYVSGDLFVWASVSHFGLHFDGKTSNHD